MEHPPVPSFIRRRPSSVSTTRESALPVVTGARLQRLIGEGSCGRVYEAVRDGGRVCAVKVLDPRSVNGEYLAYCIQKVRAAGMHLNVVPVLDFHPDDVDGPPWYAMPLLADQRDRQLVGRSLETRAAKADRALLWRWIDEMAAGLAWLHLHAIVHCSFKPRNVMLTAETRPTAQVSDFGQGWIGGVEALPLHDHIFYAPPEQLSEPTQIQFGIGERWDVYAFGVTAFRLITGKFPRAQEFVKHLDAPELHGELPDPADFADWLLQAPRLDWPDAPADATEARRREIVDKCLHLDPAQRWIDMREVREALGELDRGASEARTRAQLEEALETARREAETARQQAAGATRPRRVVATGGGGKAGLAWSVATLAVVGAGVGFTLWWLDHARLTSARESLSSRDTQLQAATVERDAGFAARDAALAKATATATAQEAEKKLALAQSEVASAMADQFFGSFLEAAGQLPADADRARLMLAGYEYFSQFVEKNRDRPELAEACLRARFNLAQVKAALSGGEEAARKFDEAREAIGEHLRTAPRGAGTEALRVREVDCALAAARLRMTGNVVSADVRQTLELALSAIQRDPAADLPPELARRAAELETLIAHGLGAEVTPDPAQITARLDRAINRLNAVMGGDKLTRPGDGLLLARAYFLRGQNERRLRQTENALASQIQAAEWALATPESAESALLLAECYGETGEMLAANAEVRDAARAFGEAIRTLSDLAQKYPTRDDLRFHLARRYADLAGVIRQHGDAARAVDYQRGAVEMVRALLDKDPASAAYAAALARMKADWANLLNLLNRKPEALAQARETLALLDKLQAGPPASVPEIERCLDIAQSYGVLGSVNEDAKEVAMAEQCFTKAVAHYESLAGVRAGDTSVEQGLTWTRARLAKLSAVK